MERVGRNIFRGGGAEIFKTCVCSGLGGGGALQTDDMVTKRGEGAPKMFRKKRKLVQMGPQSNLTQSCFPADKTLLFLYLAW